MATRSAAKAHRQSLKRRLRNRAVRGATKTAIKNATAGIASGDLEAARETVRAAIIALDRAAQKGVLHPNNAGRRKSRLLLKYNAAVAAVQVPTEERRPAKPRAAPKKSDRPEGRSPRRKQPSK